MPNKHRGSEPDAAMYSVPPESLFEDKVENTVHEGTVKENSGETAKRRERDDHRRIQEQEGETTH